VTSVGRGVCPILTATSADGREYTVDSTEFPEMVAKAAAVLAGRGIGPEHIVGLHFDNAAGLEASIFHLAVHWRGAVTVPISTRLSSREVAATLGHCRAALVLSAGDHVEALRAQAVPLLDCSAGLAVLLADVEPVTPLPIDEHTLADILYTSGTTAEPKGVEFTHGNCVSCGMELRHGMRLRPDDVYQSAVPYFTSTGAHTNPLAALVAGCHYVLEPRFDQLSALATMRRLGTTVYFAVPSMLALLVRDIDVAAEVPSSLHTVVFGGSVTTADTLERLVQHFPGRRLINSFGQTEGGPGGIMIGPDDILSKPGAAGRSGNGPHTSFSVIRPDGTKASVGETGEIVLRSPAVMRGYHRDPEATAFALRDGWLHTTDLGRIDEDGYLWFVDRRADLVIRGGFNISTGEVDRILLDYPGILEAAVVGMPHDILGEDLCAFVVTEGSLDRSELDGFLRARLADYKVPRTVVPLRSLPRSPMGKILKRELSRRARAD